MDKSKLNFITEKDLIDLQVKNYERNIKIIQEKEKNLVGLPYYEEYPR
jgi:hypothetical protein